MADQVIGAEGARRRCLRPAGEDRRRAPGGAVPGDSGNATPLWPENRASAPSRPLDSVAAPIFHEVDLVVSPVDVCLYPAA